MILAQHAVWLQISTRWGFAGKGHPLSLYDIAPELMSAEMRAERARAEEESNEAKQQLVSAMFDQLEKTAGTKGH